jgi:DNA-binding NtrC family response regulator
LENIVERAIILTRSNALSVADLAGLQPSAAAPAAGNLRPMSEVEKEHIRFCLDRMNWNIGLTAEKLGIHRNTLRAKIKEYDLRRSE